MKEHYLLQFFTVTHLLPELQNVSARFQVLAKDIDLILPDNSEKTTALRKLLEAKDCAVRAVLFQQDRAKLDSISTATKVGKAE